MKRSITLDSQIEIILQNKIIEETIEIKQKNQINVKSDFSDLNFQFDSDSGELFDESNVLYTHKLN